MPAEEPQKLPLSYVPQKQADESVPGIGMERFLSGIIVLQDVPGLRLDEAQRRAIAQGVAEVRRQRESWLFLAREAEATLDEGQQRVMRAHWKAEPGQLMEQMEWLVDALLADIGGEAAIVIPTVGGTGPSRFQDPPEGIVAGLLALCADPRLRPDREQARRLLRAVCATIVASDIAHESYERMAASLTAKQLACIRERAPEPSRLHFQGEPLAALMERVAAVVR